MPIFMSGGDDKPPDPKKHEGVAVKERATTKRPPLYRVIMHNDDYTTREFVVMVLQAIFHHSDSKATEIMLHIHNNGIGVAGIFPTRLQRPRSIKQRSWRSGLSIRFN